MKGFRDFLFRGNVIDLAVAVVVGTAFTALVIATTDALLRPLINLFLGGGVSGGKVIVNGQTFDFGAVINAAITFVITAAAVYFLVVAPMRRIMDRVRGEQEQTKTLAPSDEAVLLTEIRDLLRQAPPR